MTVHMCVHVYTCVHMCGSIYSGVLHVRCTCVGSRKCPACFLGDIGAPQALRLLQHPGVAHGRAELRVPALTSCCLSLCSHLHAALGFLVMVKFIYLPKACHAMLETLSSFSSCKSSRVFCACCF